MRILKIILISYTSDLLIWNLVKLVLCINRNLLEKSLHKTFLEPNSIIICTPHTFHIATLLNKDNYYFRYT